jgi:hypothetical protein
MRPCAALLCLSLLLPTGAAHAQSVDPPRLSPGLAGALWAAAQLVPSPVLVTGSHGVGGGVRWQITLFLLALGLVERPVRSLIVHPAARHAGALEIYAAPGWLCCAPQERTGWLLHLGSRVYLPLEGRGERLAVSVGASYYRASPHHGVAFELGVYTLSSIVGISVTVAPWLAAREVSTALTVHYY